jgi:hypothetical protein
LYERDSGIDMHLMKKRKKWSKPQLIILGGGKAEENVLAGCKGNNQTTSLNLNFNGCMKQGNCRMDSCNVIAPS